MSGAWTFTDTQGSWAIDPERMAPVEEGGYTVAAPDGGAPYQVLPVELSLSDGPAPGWDVYRPYPHLVGRYGFPEVFDVIACTFGWPLSDTRVWLGGEYYSRTFHTDSHGDLVTRPCPMSELAVGDVFVGPDEHTVYEVAGDCASNEHGWLYVRNLSMSNEQTAELLLTHPRVVEPGGDPRDGFFDFTADTTMHLVIEAQDTT